MNEDKHSDDLASARKEWWDDWWFHDYTWSAFNDRDWTGWVVVADGAHFVVAEARTLRRYGNGEIVSGEPKILRDATLQDYWRADPLTGRIRDDEVLWSEGLLRKVSLEAVDRYNARDTNDELSADCEVFHAAHFPEYSRSGALIEQDAAVSRKLLNEFRVRLLAAGESESQAATNDDEEEIKCDRRAQFEGCCFRVPSEWLGKQVSVINANFESAAFLHGLVLSHKIVGRLTSFSLILSNRMTFIGNATFNGGLDLLTSTLIGDVFLNSVKSTSCLRLRLLSPNKVCRVRDVEVKGDTEIVALRCKSLRLGALRTGTLSVSGPYSGRCEFDDLRCEDQSTFKLAQFNGFTQFRNCEFGGYAEFSNFGAKPYNEVMALPLDEQEEYASTKFLSDVAFLHVKFMSWSGWNCVAFEGGCEFLSSFFGGEADFRSARFEGDLDMSGVRFKGPVHFEHGKLCQKSKFERAAFVDRVSFRNAEFEDHASFKDAILPKDPYLSFEMFAMATFKGNVEFNFQGSPSFSIFYGAILARGASFLDADDMEQWAAFRRELKGSTWLIAETLARQLELDNGKARKSHDDHRSLALARDVALLRLAGGCRMLKNAMQKVADTGAQHLFHRFELLARAQISSTPRLERWAIRGYEFLSRQGASFSRPLIGLGTNFLLFTLIYHLVACWNGSKGEASRDVVSSESIANFSFSSMFRGFFGAVTDSDAGELFRQLAPDSAGVMLLNLLIFIQLSLSIIFIFLLGIALRRKFQMI